MVEKLKLKKILISGGTGFIGYHLAKKCLDEKLLVFSISTSKPKKYRFLNKVKYFFFDIAKQKNFKRLKKIKFDYIVNLAGAVDHKNKKKVFNSHFYGVKNLVKYFHSPNLEKFIQIGSSMEYGKTLSPQKETATCTPASFYGKAKLLSTNFLLNHYVKKKFPCTILRLYQIYGPRQDLNRLIPYVIINSIKNRNFDCSSGRQFRDFMYIGDCVDAIFRSLTNKDVIGKIINIGTGKSAQIKKIILKIQQAIKSGKPIFKKIALRKEELIQLYPNITKAKKILKWRCKVDFNKGIYKTINYYKKNYDFF